MRISFVGGGVMAESILGGILEAKIATSNDILVGEPITERRDYLKKKYGVLVGSSNQKIIEDAEIVILSVKPQNLAEVMGDIGPVLDDDKTVISIIAGAKIDSLIDGLGHQSVIRVMPNTPAQIGEGMSVWTASDSVSATTISNCQNILTTLGKEIYVDDEKFIDMATALSASGPAYIFLFIEAMIDAGVYIGMSREMASALVLQTIYGSTKLVTETGRNPSDLKDMVTSPGGTTAEALLAFEQGSFKGTVIDAVAAAYEKSKALGG